MPRTNRVLESVLYATDLDAAERFYTEVLGLTFHARQPGLFVFLRCGRGMVLIFDPDAASVGRDVPAHGAKGPGHLCFAVAGADLPAWRERLRAAGVAIEREVSWPRGGESLYFRDPAGNSLELATPTIWGLPDLPGDTADAAP
jgi:catechol 2,3-dioxygenase-like lactoylglutathione lyase family enzyme